MTPYEIICQDLSLEMDNSLELSPAPYTDEIDERAKVSLTYRCLLRAQRLKQQKRSLVYTFHLRKLIEVNEFSAKEMKRLLTDHYYIVAIRTYYIFETNPCLIELSQNTSLTTICKLSSSEYRSLVIEI